MDETLVIVGCGAAKRDEPSPAEDLYTSTYFQKKRQFAEVHGDSWKILSAEHGLIDPSTEIEPYDTTISDLSDEELDHLAHEIGIGLIEYVANRQSHGLDVEEIIVLAGRSYIEPLKERDAFAAGISERVVYPLQQNDLAGIGEQMAWLGERVEAASHEQSTLATDGGSELGIECDVDGCETHVVGLEDGYEMDRGTVCQDCTDYHDRHGHWPDEDVEICAECRIDDGMISHDCDETGADRVLLNPGSECNYCGYEAPVTDGGARMDADDGMERVDNDPNAKTGDTRLRIEAGEHNTYVLKREEYSLSKFQSAHEREGSEHGYEEYDWSLDEKFVLHGDREAKQFAAGVADAGAFDPSKLFFRQVDWGEVVPKESDIDE